MSIPPSLSIRHQTPMVSRRVQQLYRDLLHASSSLKDKNFREYFLRITKDDFRTIRPKMTESEFVEKQLENLKVLRRQSTIHNMYYTDSFTVSR